MKIALRLRLWPASQPTRAGGRLVTHSRDALDTWQVSSAANSPRSACVSSYGLPGGPPEEEDDSRRMPAYARRQPPCLYATAFLAGHATRANDLPASLLNGLPGRPRYARKRSPRLSPQRPSWPATLRAQTISPPLSSTAFLAGQPTHDDSLPASTPRPSWLATLRAQAISPPFHSTTFPAGQPTHDDDPPALPLNDLPGRPPYARRSPRLSPQRPSWQATLYTQATHEDLPGLPFCDTNGRGRGRRPRSTAFHSVGILPVCMFIEIWQLREPRPSPSWTPILRSTCCANSRLDLASTGASQTPTPTYEQRR
ncbi:hypothetical protein PLEOSDRAFT_1106092 [Pleurotus ostreatus PC15]|uniref:Uncharacterized protein n=1 Tax=Pleurotus ostreatus (strain PC15) TaxID=1137138 RepID=A0A067NGP5_PLEO1|nr:hypothetical protein PLEOSDRAFT_1106092 [Pleurotus ostreatus PC15]